MKFDYTKIKPLNKPKKNLSVMQTRLLREHQKYHSKKHIEMMKQLMKEGYCLQQAHTIASKIVGK
tara:strand:- start:243 stop:437 length:195 start_codon:yes stop_codon:yes gene_type:complete